MSTLEKSTMDFRKINDAGFDLFKKTPRQRLELLNGLFGRPVEEKEFVRSESGSDEKSETWPGKRSLNI